MKPFFTPKAIVCSISLACLFAASASHAANAKGLAPEEVVVTSQFRDHRLLDLAATVSVFDAATIEMRGANNIEQLLNLAPNVNFSSGASRGRYFQIRGIGERSQFIDPVSPSVGLIIDGIDFSGLGLAASTLDIGQVEVLRGPQGTAYGANALAGLISMTSNAPTEESMVKVSAEVAEYNSQTLGVVSSGPLSERLGYRVALQKQQSDGYIENTFLGRDDVNNIDESVVRAKLSFAASDTLEMDFNLLYLDADNGYDAFSLFQNRQTQSDQPGTDAQETVAASIITHWSGNALFSLESVLSFANSESEYSYDEDWSYVGFDPIEYSSVDSYLRDKDNISVDVRFISSDESALFNASTSWVAGVYLRQESEDLERNASFNSEFETENYALYGQLRSHLNDKFDLVSGLRFEKRNADYSDSLLVRSDKDEDLWGGNLTLEFRFTDNALLYGTLSRGYKAGGVNGRIISAAATNTDISSNMYEFDTESMINYELGLKGNWLDNRLQTQLAVFYQDRSDVQAKQSIFDPNNFSFDDFLANAAGGKTAGIEVEFNYLASESLRFFATAGLLKAEFDDFVSQSHVDAKDDNNGVALAPVNLDGREVAHAPKYQFFVGSELSLMANLVLRVELEGKDEFYFSNSHNEKSSAYELVNARLTYYASNWDVSLWGRNLTDKDYQTRGFYFSNAFGNNPANGYAPETYYQFGEPRVMGVSANYTF
ncbi:Pesticin receptor [Zhongshania aliphaticivorans]|uniref:Pesticin receptor n=1 Tax=Zhongshania aliphaticivorans TaxID=1470434 RepID=A0A5S9NL33_9GAMM|nr:TonB-dependent receptor [Zhongshania aliphaticivorans]CAA0090631.1 Pesticin receptor [Zhongshania aliphaticivorans]CAA0098135.1 Pesticin receptor [Zhongshania aliphaticivorans]